MMKKRKYIILTLFGFFCSLDKSKRKAKTTGDKDANDTETWEEWIHTCPDIKIFKGIPYLDLSAFKIVTGVGPEFFESDRFLDGINKMKKYTGVFPVFKEFTVKKMDPKLVRKLKKLGIEVDD